MSSEFPFNHFINFNSDNKNNTLDNINPYNETKNSYVINEESNSAFNNAELITMSSEILDQLKQKVSPQKFSAYFENTLTVSNILDNTVVFSVTTNFIKKIIEEHYINVFEDVLINILGKKFRIEINILGNNNHEQKEQINNTPQNTSTFKLRDNLETNDEIKDNIESTYIKYSESNYKIDKNKKFDNFITGHSNNMAYAFSLAVAKSPGEIYPQLYIHGNSGLGKTHLLYAINNYIAEKKPYLRIRYTSANDFMSEMVMSIQKNEVDVFRRKYTQLVDVLIIDDIHELKNKNRTQSEFFYIFNELQSKGKQLIFTSDKPPKEIHGIEDRIRTRLSSALLIDIQQPDLETRIAILKKKSLEKDIFLDNDVINLIATCVKTNVRELEGNLVKLGAYSDLMNVDIDLEIAKEQLNLTEDSDEKIMTVESISKAVASYYKITLGDIKGKSRKKEVALARHICMYMNHKILKKTLEEIGEFYNNRDHSTVIHGIKKIQNLSKEDSKISQQLYEIESRL